MKNRPFALRGFLIAGAILVGLALLLAIGSAMATAFAPQPAEQPEVSSIEFVGTIGGDTDVVLYVDEKGIGTRNVPNVNTRTVFRTSGNLTINYSDGTKREGHVDDFDLVIDADGKMVLYLPILTVTCGVPNCSITTFNVPLATPLPLFAPKAQP